MNTLPIPKEFMPKHVAMIMDGNGRWAKKRGLMRAFGHRKGVEVLQPIIKACGEWGIESLTLYAFSTENWGRPEDEIAALMGLINEFFEKAIDTLVESGVRIRIFGDLTRAPEKQRDVMLEAIKRTEKNESLNLNIAFNYGSQQEILRAAQALAEKCVRGEMTPDKIDDAAFCGELYTAGQKPVDLLIRTSGEQRVSNFLLYQIAYAEFYVTDTLWPSFTKEELCHAILSFAGRDRRFGGYGKSRSGRK